MHVNHYNSFVDSPKARMRAVKLLAVGVLACLPKILAPRAALLNTYNDSLLYYRAPDDRAMAGRTTKNPTLYTAFWTVRAGFACSSGRRSSAMVS